MRLIHRLVNEEYRRLQKQAIESAEKEKAIDKRNSN